MRLSLLYYLQVIIIQIEVSLQSFTQDTIVTCFALLYIFALHLWFGACFASLQHLRVHMTSSNNSQCTSILRFDTNEMKYKYIKNRKGYMSISGVKESHVLYNYFHIPINISMLQKCVCTLCVRHIQNVKISLFS